MSALWARKIDYTASHFISRLMDAEVKTSPYLHAFVTRAFPQEYYQQLLENLPPDSKYTDRQFDNRMMVRTEELGGFWSECAAWMLSPEVIGTLYEVFHLEGVRVQADVRLVRDSAGYRIKPHTDIKAKLLSLLFYLAPDEEHPEEGTTVMIPKEPGFTSDGTRRYEFDDFEDVWRAPFLPNTMLGFPRSDVSFHGVRGTTIPRRDVLLLNLYQGK